MSPRTRVILCVFLWVAAIGVAACFDRAVANGVRDSGLQQWMAAHEPVRAALKLPGEFFITVLIAGAVSFVHPLRWRAGGFLLLATIVSGINGLMKWAAGRTRPFKLTEAIDAATGAPVAAPFTLDPFRGGLAGIFVGKNLSFPSGHAALAFATAAALAMLWPRARYRWLGYAAAAVVAAERVAENAHWLSDAVAAGAVGVGGVYLIHWVVTRMMFKQEQDRRSAGPRLLSSSEPTVP